MKKACKEAIRHVHKNIIELQVTQENELNTQNVNMNAQVDVINKNIVVQHQKIP